MAREARVNVMIEPFVRERLEFYSKGMGLSMSALCAYVISQYVFQQDIVLEHMFKALSPDVVDKLLQAQVSKAQETLDAMERESSPTA